MVNHITPEELHDLDMLMYLQHTAGIHTSFAYAIEGWRSLSELAREHIRATFSTMQFTVTGYKPEGGHSDVPTSVTASKS